MIMNKMTEEDKKETRIHMEHAFDKLISNYITILEEYHETFSRDSAFLKDAVDSILGIQAVLEVYARDKEIHPEYVLEKIGFTKQYIDGIINYYESLIKEKEN